MGIFAEFTDKHGRRCVVHDGRGGLGEVLANYEACGAESPDEELRTMEPITIQHDDILTFADGREGTGADLALYAARQEADRAARRYEQDGLGTYAEGYHRYLAAHPQLRARLARVPMSVEDALRRQPGQAYAVSDGVATVHVSGTVERRHGSINRSDLLAPPPGVRIVWGPDFASMGQRPEQVVFDKATFGHQGLCESWLKQVGLVASAWEETFSQFIATIFTGDAPSPDRVQYSRHEEIPQGPGITGSYLWPEATQHAAGARHLRELTFDAGAGWTRAGALGFLEERGLPAPLEVEELLDQATKTVRAFRFIFHLDPSGVVPR